MQNGHPHKLEYKGVPVVGQIAAGSSIEFLPIMRFRDVRLPRWANAKDKFVIAEVCGDSLVERGVFNGDMALILLTHEIKQGELAAVRTPEGMLIKFVYEEADGRIRLESAHRNHPPRRFDAEDIEIQGRVVRTERDW